MLKSAGILALLLMSSCAASGRGTDFCAVDGPIFVSKDDVLTEATAADILDHNDFWEKECQ